MILLFSAYYAEPSQVLLFDLLSFVQFVYYIIIFTGHLFDYLRGIYRQQLHFLS